MIDMATMLDVSTASPGKTAPVGVVTLTGMGSSIARASCAGRGEQTVRQNALSRAYDNERTSEIMCMSRLAVWANCSGVVSLFRMVVKRCSRLRHCRTVTLGGKKADISVKVISNNLFVFGTGCDWDGWIDGNISWDGRHATETPQRENTKSKPGF